MVQHQILTPQADPMLHHFLARLLQHLDFILLVSHSHFKLCWTYTCGFFLTVCTKIGALQGLHNIHGSYNLPNMPGSLASRNAAMGGVPSGGVQQPGGNIPSGRFASNNILVALTQVWSQFNHALVYWIR